MSSLYLHLPYCLYKCHYCDFNSYASKLGQIPFEAYAQAVLRELDSRLQNEPAVAQHLSTSLETIFLGGGTPSLFPARILKGLVEKIKAVIPANVVGMTKSVLEITMEANPGTITQDSLKAFAQETGITRLSLGIQSLHDQYLGKYGRIHTATEALKAVEWIKAAGFQSWSCDLMFGFPAQPHCGPRDSERCDLPAQSLEEWKSDLQKIVDQGPPHLSCYAFTVEKDAPYGRQVSLGNAPVPDEDVQADMFQWTREFLSQNGYDAYEISNFAKPGFESRHNLNYWNYGSYLGLGAGAVSFLHSTHPFVGYRQTGIKTPEGYLKQWGILKSQAVIPAFGLSNEGGNPDLGSRPHNPPLADHVAGMTHSYESISPETAMGEFMMMGLRLKRGVSASKFKEYFGVELEQHFASAIKIARDKGWMTQDQLALTGAGFTMANQVVGLFLA